jgi:hypothetical protein
MYVRAQFKHAKVVYTGKAVPGCAYDLFLYAPSLQGENLIGRICGSPTDSIVRVEHAAMIDTIFAGNEDTTIIIKANRAILKGHIIADQHQPVYTVKGVKGQTITAMVRPSKKGGNVRINQIQQPGGAFDGPFGDSLSYTFREDGSLRFIIGENLMAGDPYTGDFIFHLFRR